MEALDRAVRAGRSIRSGPPERLAVTALDSFDWRVWRAGGRLFVEESRGRATLRWLPRDAGAPYAVSVTATPARGADLPSGFLRERLAGALEIRALLPLGRGRLIRTPVELLDADGACVERVFFELWAPLDERARAVAATATWRLDHPGGPLTKIVKRIAAPKSETVEPLALLTAACGRTPGDYSSKPRIRLHPGEPAATALRRILGHMVEVAERNVPGVVADLDPEFLHDLRVAVRRTRSLLGQVKGVFPERRLAPLVRELRWLGSITGPCRDLDIFLLDLGSYRSILPEETAAGLEEIVQLAVHDRRLAQRKLARSLATRRFGAAMERWRLLATAEDDPGTSGPHAGRPIRRVAGERILRAHRRLLRHGLGLADDPPAQALHRLRIDAKKLRYLLELFADLYPGKPLNRLVGELKTLQDLLGEHNDVAVQQQRLAGLAGRLEGADAAAVTFVAIGRIEEILERRGEELRHGFAERFERFASGESRRAYARLFGGAG